MTLGETIRETTRKFLEGGGLLCAQNVTAVGWIGGSVPDDLHVREQIVEFPTSDVSNAGIAVGMALSGKRVIQVVRYQGFLHFNAPAWSCYAAKARDGYEMACPLLIRALCMEGAIGGTGGAHHGMVMRMPGLKVRAPMTPYEWTQCFDEWMSDTVPMFLSENRKSFASSSELVGATLPMGVPGEVVLLPIGGARLEISNAVKMLDYLRVSSVPIVELRPFLAENHVERAFEKWTRFGLVIDSDYDMVARDIAHRLLEASGVPVYALGLEDRHPGFGPTRDVTTPSASRIAEKVLELLRR